MAVLVITVITAVSLGQVNIKVSDTYKIIFGKLTPVSYTHLYAPMVAEAHEYQYNADAFEARGVDEVKQEAEHKEVSKVIEDKAR